MALAPAEPIGSRSPPSAARTISVSAGGRVRLTTRIGGRSTRGGSSGGSSVDSVMPGPGRATAATVGNPFSTSATCTAQSVRGSSPNSRVPSSGSTIQVRAASTRLGVVGPFLGEDGVVGVRLAQPFQDEVVGAAVALVLELGGVEPAGGGLGPDLEQERRPLRSRCGGRRRDLPSPGG